VLSRNAPHARTLADANVWLDAAFSPRSVARRVVSALRSAGVPLLLEELTEREVLDVLNARRLALGLRYDPSAHFLAYVANVNCLRVPPAPPDIEVNEINRADRHIARAAVHYLASLLTGDAPLVSQCRRARIFATFPWTVVAQMAAAHPIDEILRIVPPTSQKGTIFARTTPGGWSGMTAVGTFTVVDIENVGRLAFDTQTSEWLFACSLGLVVKLKYPQAGQGTTIVCASYDLNGAGQQGNIVLRAARLGSIERPVRTASTRSVLSKLPGQMRIGSSLGGNCYWNGYLRHLTVGPEGMSPQKWRAITEVEDAAPNPMNRDVLDVALLAMDGFG
jgi:hypothetical protein